MDSNFPKADLFCRQRTEGKAFVGIGREVTCFVKVDREELIVS